MKYKNLIIGALLLVCAGLLFAALIKHAVVPNDAVLKDSDGDSAVIGQATLHVPVKYDIKFNRATYFHMNIDSSFMDYFRDFSSGADTSYLFVLDLNRSVAMTLDTLNVLTIYDPSITVVWDTLR